MNRGRPSFIVYGNCQAEFLGLLLSNATDIASRFDVAVASNNLDDDSAIAPVAPLLDRAVLYWEQYDQRPAVEIRDRLRNALPAKCAVVRYPAVGMDAFWPFMQRDPRNVPEPGYPFGRYPLGDRVAMEVAGLDLPPDQAYARYMQISRERMPDVQQLLSRDRAILSRRDAGCDVSMSDFVFENLRSAYQFWTRGHLAICVMAELLRRLLLRSRDVLGDPAAASAQLESVYERFPGQGEFQHPIHPLVIEQLGLRFVDERTQYRWFSNSWTFEEHVKRYIAFDRSW